MQVSSSANAAPSPEQEIEKIFRSALHVKKATILWDYFIFLQASAEKKNLTYYNGRRLDYYEFADRYIFPVRCYSKKLGDFSLSEYHHSTDSLLQLQDDVLCAWWRNKSPFSERYDEQIQWCETSIQNNNFRDEKQHAALKGALEGMKEAKNEIMSSPHLRLIKKRYPQFFVPPSTQAPMQLDS